MVVEILTKNVLVCFCEKKIEGGEGVRMMRKMAALTKESNNWKDGCTGWMEGGVK
jgi:hypothetical protein